MKKRAFTIVELLMASGIFFMILVMGMSIISLITSTLYNGQTESGNRSNLNDVIFYITREIQSAEEIKITDSGKTIEIKQRGCGDLSLTYSFCEHYPTGYLAFGDKRLLDVDFDKSKIEHDGNKITISIAIVKNDTELNQRAKVVSFSVKPRSESVEVEVT